MQPTPRDRLWARVDNQRLDHNPVVPLFIDLTALAQALDSEQAHTSFGKLPLSVEKSQAQFSFPQANRWDGCKKFDAELTKTENIGKNAPGPQYMYDDKIKYAEVSPSFWPKGTFQHTCTS